MAKNKEQQFKQVYKATKDQVYRLCLGFTGNEADAYDLFQEIQIKVWSHLESFRKESNIKTWVYRIATNTALLFVSQKKRREQKKSNISIEYTRIESNEIDPLDEDRQINELYTAISSLKEIDRLIISLLLDKNSYEDIANITGLTPSNVGVRINRIKKTLSEKLS